MQQFLARLFDRLMKSWSWVLLIVGSILIKWVSWYPGWVERNYTYGVYPVISRVQRFLFGWIPFSVGDLFYAFLIIILIVKTYQLIKLIVKRRLNRTYFTNGLQQLIFFFLFVYVFFNLLWGLNYNRVGIARQLDLRLKSYTIADLDTLATTLQTRLNLIAPSVGPEVRDSFERKRQLFNGSCDAYKEASKKYSFLQYTPRSIKPSMFSYAGNYLGFQGYYNPFSGEGQVNTTVPQFLEPYVTTHEMAHQLGYARENEANFVGFLACRASSSAYFKYSMYLDLYRYAVTELYRRNSYRALALQDQLHPQVKKDILELQQFFRKYKNPIEPVIMWFYGHYLKANNQPGGKDTYNEVVATLVAYYKKFGIEAL